MPVHSFVEKLNYSLGEHEKLDCEILKKIIPGCISVIKTNIEVDKTGIDYVATLSGGAKIGIDAKTREEGASHFWKYNEPELALESWSVVPTRYKPGKIGWTLSNASNVDLILFTFSPKDSREIYLLPFQHLRAAFWTYGREWMRCYGYKTQNSGLWKSCAVFVPASVVIDGIKDIILGKAAIV